MHDAYLSELTALRDQLKAGLSAAPHESGNDAGPSVSKLADKIKAIKAANTIEAAPQRVRQKHSSAEEPVTARIRRRSETTPVSDHAVEYDTAPEAGATQPAASAQNSPGKPPMTFQERLTMERQRKNREPSLS